MNVLLSIRPKYVKEIVTGKKKYEFRKLIWKRKDLKKAIIYSSAPTKKIIGVFSIGDVIEGNPMHLWSKFRGCSGVSKDEFFEYFGNSETGFAIEIDQIKVFKNPVDPFQQFPEFRPPQSFYYIDDNTTEGFEGLLRNRNRITSETLSKSELEQL